MKKLYLFKRDLCSPCSFVYNHLKTINIEPDRLVNMSEDDPEGFEKAAKFQVMTVPAMVLHDEENDTFEKVTGADLGKINVLINKRFETQ